MSTRTELAPKSRGRAERRRSARRCSTVRRRPAIAEQRELELDEWTGGEDLTDNFIEDMRRTRQGLEIDEPDQPDPFDDDDLAHCVITGELSAPRWARLRTRLSCARAGSPGGVLKPTRGRTAARSPSTRTTSRRSSQRQMPTLIGIVNQRAAATWSLRGARTCSLTCRSSACLGNAGADDARSRPPESIAACFEGVDGATRGVRIGNGNLKGRPMCADRPQRVVGADLPAPGGRRRHRRARVQLLRRVTWSGKRAASCRGACELAAGTVDEASYGSETVKKIGDRAADRARVVGEERRWLSPSCGLRPPPARTRPVL